MPSISGFLSQVSDSFGQMHDYAHASRLYVNNFYALTPKASWLYYVSFKINPLVIEQINLGKKEQTEIGMLVKRVDLPQFQMETEVVNQYNRKTVVQKRLMYQPINISLHDDRSNTVHSMWLNYYDHYFADARGNTIPASKYLDTNRISGPDINNRYNDNQYQIFQSPSTTPVTYGLNNDQSIRFFDYITIYQLNQHRFTGYTLINPLISSWQHDRLDQSNGNRLAESQMSVTYETVWYSHGTVSSGIPGGFADLHYDKLPSPLGIYGRVADNITGPTGLISGVQQIFGADSNRDLLDTAGDVGGGAGLIGAVLAANNLIKGAKSLNAAGIAQEGYSILNATISGAGNRGIPGTVGGLVQGVISKTFNDRPLSPGSIAQGLSLDNLSGNNTTVAQTGSPTPEFDI